MKSKFKYKIKEIPEWVTKYCGLKVGDKFNPVRSQMTDDFPKQMAHLVFTKNGKAIVVYESEVEVIQ